MSTPHPIAPPLRRPVAVSQPATVMGILNVTPDSFSDGGSYASTELAVERARHMVDEGADIIDIGGESTRPGAEAVPFEVEMERVLPTVAAISPFCRVAIDTRNEKVARAAVEAGASIINDVSAGLGLLAAELGVGWIAMHMAGTPATMQVAPSYENVVREVTDFLVDRAEQASAAGCEEIWIDPGFGFGKLLVHNMSLLANLDRLVATGWPVAVGTSRKGMLGALLAQSDGADQPVPVEERLVGSVATATYAMLAGAQLVRVHDVKAARQAATVVAGRRKV